MNRKISGMFGTLFLGASLLTVPITGANASGPLSSADTAGLSACSSFTTMFAFADAFNALPKARRVATRASALATLQADNARAQASLATAIRASSRYNSWASSAAVIARFAASGNGSGAEDSAAANIRAKCVALHASTGR